MKLGRMVSSLALMAAMSWGGPASAQTADVMHYWTSGGEAAAMKQVVAAFEKAGGTWKDSPVTGYEALRASVLSRLAGGDAPTAMVADLGEVKALVDEGVLASLNDVLTDKDWQKHFPALVAEKASVDGQLYAIPIDIGSGNWLWYSTKIFADVGVTPPKTWDEFFIVADKIKAKGIMPLAFGAQAWQEALVFRTVMVGEGGIDFYRKVYIDHDVEASGGAAMVKAFETFGKLRGYVDEGATNRNWNDATNMVITDKAAMQIMGDWAKGEFQAAGLTPGKEFGCEQAPGTAGTLNIVSDVFAFPAGDSAEQVASRTLLANVLMDPKTQIAFNQAKGALPPLLGVDTSSFDVCTQKAAALIGDPAKLAPNGELSFSSDTVGAIKDLVTQFWSTPSMAPADAAKQFADIVARN